MEIFLRVALVLIGIGNWSLLTAGPHPAVLAEYVVEQGWSILPDLLHLSIFAGLGMLVAEFLLRWMRSVLEGGFFVRYATMAGAVWVSGMLYVGTTGFVAGLVAVGPPDLYTYVPGIIERILSGIVLGFLGIWIGALVGMMEGLILGFPLAALLGLFRSVGSRSDGTAT